MAIKKKIKWIENKDNFLVCDECDTTLYELVSDCGKFVKTPIQRLRGHKMYYHPNQDHKERTTKKNPIQVRDLNKKIRSEANAIAGGYAYIDENGNLYKESELNE